MARVTNTQGPAFLVAELATGEEVELSGQHSEDKEAIERAGMILEDYPKVEKIRIEFSPMVVARTTQTHVEEDLEGVEGPEQPPVEPEPGEPETTGEWEGSWDLQVTAPGGGVTTGSLAIESGAVTLSSGGLSGTGPATIDGDSLTAALDVPGVGQVNVSLTLDGDDLSGSFTAGGGTYTVTGVRDVEEPPVDPPNPPDPPGEPGEAAPGWGSMLGGGRKYDWDQHEDEASLIADMDQDADPESGDPLAERAWAKGVALNQSNIRDVIRLVDSPGGGKMLRTIYPGAPHPGGDEQPAVDMNLPASVRGPELFVRTGIRIAENFRSNGWKTLFFFANGTADRYEFRLGEFGGIRAMVKLDNNRIDQANDIAKDPNTGAELDILNGPIPFFDGELHDLMVHIRTGTNGFFKVWWDGRILIDVPRVNLPAGTFNTIALSRNGAPTTEATVDYEDVCVWASDPGLTDGTMASTP